MKKIGCLLLALGLSVSLFADEGMWMLNTLKKENWNRMRQLGFTLPESQLYNPDNASLKDAVVHFNGGCTGVTVSDKGLIFTNHHCGYGAIQSQSSLDHDYLKNGFIAKTIEEEIPIPNMYVRYLIKTEDVTDRILSKLDDIKEESDRLKKIDEICTAIEDSVVNKSEFITGSVSAYFDNNAYYLNVYQTFTDVRMVFAPPSSVGKFGGDTDNWMWPRHTGDFSVFRVYANSENKPAEYSVNNVPYKPRYVAPVSLQGYEKGSYSMTIGYPGRTSRYLSSWGVLQRVNSSNKPRIEVRGIKQDIWNKAMLASDDVRIKYSSKYAGSSNYWKNSIGMNRGIERLHVVERKQALEQQFTSWINQDSEKKAFYSEALDLVKEGYTATNSAQEELTYITEAFLSGTELTRLTMAVMAFDMTEPKDQMKQKFQQQVLPFFKDYDPTLDQKVMAAMLKIVQDRVPADKLPSIYKEINKKYKNEYEKYVSDVFSKSAVPYPDKLEKMLLDPKNINKMDKDPAYVFTKSVREAFSTLRSEIVSYRYDILKGERLFFSGLQQMMPDKEFSADANSTMRMSYGSINGYVPYDAAYYDYYTTASGIFEKYRKDDPEFDVQPEILGLLKSENFGPYEDTKTPSLANKKHMNVCFLSNNDITGGNSGSPMFNGRGELIGLAFDGNWEAMSGDIVFEPEVQKTIGVDIRYVLFMIDKWGNCPRLLEEINAK